MKPMTTEQLRYRFPNKSDGANVWKLVKDSGKLDVNTPYFYVTMSHWFSRSCMLVEDIENGRLVGVIVGFRQPENPDTLFIWQITVADDYRGKGIALLLLDEAARQSNIQYVEATISPSNASSRRLFEKWATAKKVDIVRTEGFGRELFPNNAHEQEDLYVIGPLKEYREHKGEKR